MHQFITALTRALIFSFLALVSASGLLAAQDAFAEEPITAEQF